MPKLRPPISIQLSLGLAILLTLAMLLNPLSAPVNHRDARSIQNDLLRIPFRGVTRIQAAVGDILDREADGVLGQKDFTSNTLNPPTAASLNNPGGVAVHYMGRLFVADTGNNRVLSWASVESYEDGGEANLVLGQTDFTSNSVPVTPTAASLNAPTGVAVDFDGNLYVADSGNNRVLVFPALDWDEEGTPRYNSGMDATVVVGQPDFKTNSAPTQPTAASLNHPLGIAVDGLGNLAVADSGNHRVLIFEWPLEDGVSATGLIGQPDFTTGTAPSSPTDHNLHSPSAVAVNMLDNRLYVADTGHHRVLAYNRDLQFTDEMGSLMLEAKADRVFGQPNFTSGAEPVSYSLDVLKSPTALTVDSGDRLYVADAFHRVLSYSDPLNSSTPDSEIFGTGSAGTSSTALKSPSGLASDIVVDSLFVADSGNHRVLEYYVPLTNARPTIAKLYPATVRAGTNSVDVEIRATGVTDDTTVQVNGQTRQPKEIYVGLVVVTLNAQDLAAPGSLSITITTPPLDGAGGGVSNALSLTVYSPAPGDAVADRVLGQLDFFTGDDPFFYPDAGGSLYQPMGAAIDPKTGRLFVSDWGNYRVLSWPNARQFADGAPADIVFGQESLDAFEVYSPAFGGSGLTNRSVDDPLGLTVDNNGNLYVADGDNNRILIFKPPFQTNMEATKILGQVNGGNQPASATTLRQPMSLVVDGSGNLYVADRENCRVLIFKDPLNTDKVADKVLGQVDLNTATIVGDTATAQNFRPYGLAVDGSGNLFVVDSHFSRILIFNDALNSDAVADKVLGQPNMTTGTWPDKASTTTMYFPGFIALDRQGNLFVSDLDYHRVLRFDQPLTLDAVADAVYGQPDFVTSTPNTGGISRTSMREPGGLAVDASGNLFVVDQSNNRLLVFEQGQQSRMFLPVVTR